MKQFYFLALVVMMAVSLIGCQKSNELTEAASAPVDELYLKSAGVDDIAIVKYVTGDGKVDYYSVYDDILFSVFGSSAALKAKILDRTFLEVKKFNLLGNNQAMFSVGEIGSETGVKDIYAGKLPFKAADYGLQAKTGDARFNGVLKAKNYVLAVKDDHILIYNLASGADKITAVKISLQSDVLTLKVGIDIWTLKFVAGTPIGNIFELSTGGNNFICCTIS